MAASMLLVSCSIFQPVIDIVPGGSLEEGVVFYLGDLLRKHQQFTITGLTVLEELSNGSTRMIWCAEGAESLRYITYGAEYANLKECRRPLRLKRGKKYEVFVYTSTGAKRLDVFAFRIDEDGKARQVPWVRL